MADAATNQASEHPHAAVHRAFEFFGIVAAGALITTIVARVVTVVTSGDAVLVLAMLVVGALIADLFSGLVHWTFDRFGDERTPVVGAAFVKPFRLHHTDPKDILRHGFLETNGNTSLATVIPLGLLLLVPVDHTFGLLVVIAVTTAAMLTILTNQFHKWAHDPSPPKLVARLQSLRLLLPRDHHAVHHAWPHETHYCITTGWMNAVLPKRFWATCEYVVARIGLSVHRG